MSDAKTDRRRLARTETLIFNVKHPFKVLKTDCKLTAIASHAKYNPECMVFYSTLQF